MSNVEIVAPTRTEETKAQYRDIYARLCRFTLAERRRRAGEATIGGDAPAPLGAIPGDDTPPAGREGPAAAAPPTPHEVNFHLPR